MKSSQSNAPQSKIWRATAALATALLTPLLSLAASSALLLPASAAEAQMPRTSAPENAVVYFITPSDRETVTNPITVRFGLRGMGVGPAGLDNPMTGHHHLIIDAPLPPDDLPIPNDEKHRHFGGGQTEVTFELEPGKHTLQLIVGDKNHVPHMEPIVSKKIRITVK